MIQVIFLLQNELKKSSNITVCNVRERIWLGTFRAQLDDVAALTARPPCAQWGHHVHCTVWPSKKGLKFYYHPVLQSAPVLPLSYFLQRVDINHHCTTGLTWPKNEGLITIYKSLWPLEVILSYPEATTHVLCTLHSYIIRHLVLNFWLYITCTGS